MVVADVERVAVGVVVVAVVAVVVDVIVGGVMIVVMIGKRRFDMMGDMVMGMGMGIYIFGAKLEVRHFWK